MDWLASKLKFTLFEFTTKWGLQPWRALVVLLLLIPCFAIFYSLFVKWPHEDGIWRVWSKERVRDDLGSKKPELLKTNFLKALGFGLYFSTLSAFHIGWRDLNVGNWLSRLQRREYTLQATGWVRTISGIQSLISVYLLFIWFLTQFGRPFG